MVIKNYRINTLVIYIALAHNCLMFDAFGMDPMIAQSPIVGSWHSEMLPVVESNITPLHLTHSLHTNTIPAYMYDADAIAVDENPKGLFHYLYKGLHEKNMVAQLEAYRQEQSKETERAAIVQRHTEMLYYLEREVLPYHIKHMKGDMILAHMQKLKAAYLGGHVRTRQNAALIWNNNIYAYEGDDPISSALAYLQADGLEEKDVAAWNSFWREVRKRGNGNLQLEHIENVLHEKKNQNIHAMIDRVCYIVPDVAQIPIHIEKALSAPADDEVSRAARLYRTLMRLLPLQGYNAEVSLSLLNAALIQAHIMPIPYRFNRELSNIASFAPLELLTTYIRLLSTRITSDVTHERFNPLYGYTDQTLAILASMNADK